MKKIEEKERQAIKEIAANAKAINRLFFEIDEIKKGKDKESMERELYEGLVALAKRCQDVYCFEKPTELLHAEQLIKEYKTKI